MPEDILFMLREEMLRSYLLYREYKKLSKNTKEFDLRNDPQSAAILLLRRDAKLSYKGIRKIYKELKSKL